MKKKILILALITSLFGSVFTTTDIASAKSTDVKATVYVAGEESPKEISAFIRDGRTYVPFRDLFSALSLEVSYDPQTKVITGKNDKMSISFKAGDKSVTINGTKQEADTAIIESGVTYVPAYYVNKGTGLTLKPKAAGSRDLVVEGKTTGRKALGAGKYYEGEGLLQGENFIPSGSGKIYYKDGSVYAEAYDNSKDGETGYFKDGEMEGWFLFHTGDLGYTESYMIVELKKNSNIGIGSYYDSNDELLYTKDFEDGGKITVYKKVK